MGPSNKPTELCVDDKKYKSKIKIDGETVRKKCKQMKLNKKKNRLLYCDLKDKVTKEPVSASCKAGCLVCGSSSSLSFSSLSSSSPPSSSRSPSLSSPSSSPSPS